MKKTSLAIACWLGASGCGSTSPPDANDPANVPFGTTAIVVVVNPAVNDVNRRVVPLPGSTRAGVTVTSDDKLSATTDASGIAVLSPVTPGARTLTFTGTGVSGTVAITIASGALRELAVATDATRAQLMVDVDYKTDQAVQVAPTMTAAEVNAILKDSDRVVFFAGGSYAGDLELAGSRVTLFGEGAQGGRVLLDGNLKVSGSDSRIRGTRILGNLTITGSGVGLSFSRVDGTITTTASDGKLLANALCGAAEVTGSGTIVVGNTGMPPLPTCP
jgi:hypothetical protein